jgi:L-Ala-D/L-Glu epimerase
MRRDISAEIERFPIAGSFRISRGSKTEAEVVTCTISDGAAIGRGECVPYSRYGESLDLVKATIESIAPAIRDGAERLALLKLLPAGAARNAVDCALWDLEAKQSGRHVEDIVCLARPQALTTAMTISLGEPDEMAVNARKNAFRPLLKVKVGTEDDRSRIKAVAEAAPESRIILDANEGWTPDNIADHLAVAAQYRIALIEQPLPQGKDEILRTFAHPVPICADESVHGADDLEQLVGLYDAVNIKLDKTGGLTAAIELRDRARSHGFAIMVGCMVGTSLAMAPAILLAQDADFVDLDGPLLLAKDRSPALRYTQSLVSPPEAELWG